MGTARVARHRQAWLRLFILAGVALSVLLLGASPTFATPCESATISWDGGAGTQYWSDAANWTDNRLPATTDVVCIAGSSTAVTLYTGTAEIKSLESAGELTLSGGVLRLTDTSQTSTARIFKLFGGALGGPATFRVDQTMTWSNGEMTDAGLTLIPSAAQLNITGQGFLKEGRVLRNEGKIVWTSEDLYTYAGSRIENLGRFEIYAAYPDATIWNQAAVGATQPHIFNSGTIFKNSSQHLYVMVPLENDGSMESTGFSLMYGGSGGQSSSGEYSGAIAFNQGTFDLAGAELNSGVSLNTTVRAIGATPTVVPTGQSVELYSATLGGTGTFQVDGTISVANTTMTDAGSTLITSSGRMNVNQYDMFLQAGRSIHNDGTVSWTAGEIRAYSGTSIINTGLFEISNFSSDRTFYNASPAGSQPPSIHNTGTIRKTGTTNITVNASIDNDGVAESLGTGTLMLAGGSGMGATSSGSYEGTVAFAGGTHRLEGAELRSGVFAYTALEAVGSQPSVILPGQTVTLSAGAGAGIGGSGTFRIDGTLNWTFGDMSGSGTTQVSASGRLNITTNDVYLKETRVIDNEGTISWTSGTLHGYTGGSIENRGLFEISNFGSDRTFHNDSPVGSVPPLIHNTGTIRKSGTTGINVYAALDNDGQVETVGTGWLALRGGSAGSVSSGTFAGTIDLAEGTHQMEGAELRTGVRIYAPLHAVGTQPTTIPVGNTVTMTAAAGAGIFGSGMLRVDGILNWTFGEMSGSGTTHISPSGTLNITPNDVYLKDGRQIDNEGSIVWSGGVLEAGTGTKILNSGTFTIPGDRTLTNPAGTTIKPRIVNTGSIHKSGGAGTATFAADVRNETGTIKIDSGTLRLGALENYSTTLRRLTGGSYVLKGGLRFDDADVLDIRGDLTLDGNTAAISDQSGLDGLRSLQRVSTNGSLKLLGGKAVTTPGSFVNSGSVRISGTSKLTTAGVTSSGVLSLESSGARLEAPGATVSVTGGELNGIGTIQGSVSNSGLIDPGMSTPGTLTISGSYTQSASGTLATEVSSTASYDRLAVGSTTTLDGTLAIDASTYGPMAADTFDIVTHAGRTGSFDTISGAQLGGGKSLWLTHPTGRVRLETITPTPWGASVTINSGGAYANSRGVTLTIPAPAGYSPTAMRVANDAAPTGAFQPYSSTIMWQLADLDGTRVVHAQLKDASGNTSEVVVDSIVLDRGAPHATVAPPTNPTANVAILFSETVTAVSSQNVVLRLVDTTVDLPATLTCRDAAMVVVSCATGLSVSVTLDPVAPLLPTRSYTVVINPSGRPPLTDEAGNAAIASSHPFNL